MPILALEGQVIYLILLEQVEQRLVTPEAHRSQLVIVPLLVEHILYQAVLVSSKGRLVHLCAVFT